MPENKVALKLNGREIEPRLPAFLQPSARGTAQADDVFLPAGYLRATKTFDASPTARGAADAAADLSHKAGADEVVVLELADRGIYITNAAQLRATLKLTHPELIGPHGEILLEELRATAAAPRGFLSDTIGGLVSKVYTFVVGESQDAIIKDAAGSAGSLSELGVTWAGTKALMWAIENRLDQKPGLYRWVGSAGTPADLETEDLSARAKSDADAKPILVFIHGTGSSSGGSFGDVRSDADLWASLERKYTGGIFAFEHRTLSQGPIENAIDLLRALPDNARVTLVSHSRGGLVADLLCLGDFGALIDGYRYRLEGVFDPDPDEARRVLAELASAHEEQRGQLTELAKLLRERRVVIERYVRVASPARGTLLASGNFDLFLSGLLTLIGQVPFLFGSPWYSAFKRVVIEIAKNRTNPHLVPGIEAMVPDSPMAHFLRDAPLARPVEMAVIAGDIEGGSMLMRLGVLLTDFLLFDNTDNDLVVDTQAMLGGIAPVAASRVLFARGADVSHFRYFTNQDTRLALGEWLVTDKTAGLQAFHPLPTRAQYKEALAAAARRDIGDADRPVVVILPGVMGSHLGAPGDANVWLDPFKISMGGLDKIAWGQAGVEAEEIFAMSYGKLAEYLAKSHRVERFAYDWRQPLDVLAERLGEMLDGLLAQTDKPLRLVAHSMGGLVVRACIYKRRAVMDKLMQRDGARLIMLGTPHQGAHSMVENLLGKGGTLRNLVRLDLKHDMQEVLDIVSGFRGALQLLPKPGFKDTFQGQDDGGAFYDYQREQTWLDLNAKVRDFWFGDHKSGKPTQAVLDSASWLWSADGAAAPALPAQYEKNSVYVFGIARNTTCGICEDANGQLKMVGTTRGDGTVTWDSGRIGGIGRFFYMPAVHGDLAATSDYFPAIDDLLASGVTSALATEPPATRAIEEPRPIVYDAGPPAIDDPDTLERGIVGGSLSARIVARPKRRLEVAVKAMDLRFLSMPIMVGHYERDPIAGPQALIDRELLDGDLSERHSLGLYAGARGTAIAVLRRQNALEAQRGSLSGAVVIGLGEYDGALSVSNLTEAIRAGVLRYLLQVVDVLGKDPREVSLAALLVGYNSSANMTVGASVEALVRGVMEANARFAEITRLDIRVGVLDIVELYLDTAITAVYELRRIAGTLAQDAAEQGTSLVFNPELAQGEGVRQRLFDSRTGSYWPRMMIVDADRVDRDCSPPSRPAQSAGITQGSAPDDGAPDGAVRTAVADRLRFVYVGQRARAESVMQQRQPGLIEALVRQQIHDSKWREDIGRMLFQLMVPHDFKDAAREMTRIVLVVDSYTANMPWELLLADDPNGRDQDARPLALRTAMVRQMSSATFRARVRQATARSAFVVGNPSVRGFGAAFPGTTSANSDPPPLGEAEKEASAVARTLTGLAYDVAQAIGDETEAKDVLGLLYRQPYRILHISAHGVFNLKHKDGRYRSGVLLSDGLLITAAEIDAMETVPELVFLNCCHLGTMELPTGRDANRLAASVARELMEIGVRCVIVAGWAVDDEYAKRFGVAFYESLLLDKRPFGDAVFEARKALWSDKNARSDITWGAFQAYGDPGWLAEPGAASVVGSDSGPYASPDELLDELARIRADVSRRAEHQTDHEIRSRVRAIEGTLKDRCPAAWLSLPELQSALGATWSDLYQFDLARDAFVKAVEAEDVRGRVPIKDIQRLANVEARLGEVQGDPSLVMNALHRLDGLDLIVTAGIGAAPASQNAERSALRGSAYKRLASLGARILLKAARYPGALQAKELDDTRRLMERAVADSVQAYAAGMGASDGPDLNTYLALNRLALEVLTPWPNAQARDAAIALARACGERATQSYAKSASVWDAVMVPEAIAVERMIDGSLGKPGEAGQAAYDDVKRAYAEAMRSVTIKPSQLDSIATQMEVLSRLCDAKTIVKRDPALTRIADRLLDLAHFLQPQRPRRADRPLGKDGEPSATPSTAADSATVNAAHSKVRKQRAAKKKAKPRPKSEAGD